MANAIETDWHKFKSIIDGRIRDDMKKLIKTGQFRRLRPTEKGKLSVPFKQIDLPHIVYGRDKTGIGAGPGKPGDVIGHENGKGQGRGNKPGEGASEGMEIDVEMEELLKLLGEELGLPRLQPKSEKTFEEDEIKYNGISKVGPRALVHRRRTLKQTLKRELGSNEALYKKVPGSNKEVRVFRISQDDFRFRQWNVIKKPASNAAIFFIRDGSGSMDDQRCEMVSDIAFWIDMWIKQSYKEVKKIYVWHDSAAHIVSQNTFYKRRAGGGTMATPSLKLVRDQIKLKYSPSKWNIYVFYFGDGETFGQDNKEFFDLLKGDLGPQVVNMHGVVQVLSVNWEGSLKGYIDSQLEKGKANKDFIRTAIAGEQKQYHWGYSMPDEERDAAVKGVIQKLLGKNQQPN